MSLRAHVVNFIHRAWGSKDYFPGPQPVSIETKHFPVLKRGAYMVCEKTDGERHMLVALTYEGKRTCVFVNRAFKMIEVSLRLKKSAYEGTILDGELYGNTLMVYDAVLVCGQSVWNCTLLERLQASRTLMQSVIQMKSDAYRVTCKTFHHMKDFETFMNDHLPTVEQVVDGLVFTPVNEPIRIGTHETMFKWKPREKNTVDFMMKREGSVWRLYIQDKGTLYFESDIPPNRFEDEPWFEDGAIVECQYMTDDAPMWWRPLKRRYDKTHPNNRRTFYRTIVNIKENIQMHEFLACRP